MSNLTVEVDITPAQLEAANRAWEQVKLDALDVKLLGITKAFTDAGVSLDGVMLDWVLSRYLTKEEREDIPKVVARDSFQNGGSNA